MFVCKDGLDAATVEVLSRRRGKGRGLEEPTTGKGRGSEEPTSGELNTTIRITLNFKRFIFDPKKQMYQ